MTATTVLYFLGASLALTIAPGPDNTFIVAQGISRGRKAAIITALGMCSGISVHTTAAALGISALLYSSATAFQVLKFAGAAYLLFLAWKSLKEQQILLPQGVVDGLSFRALFRRGFVMNVINPKVALFFLAFLPQFVSPGSESASLQMFLLGLLFMVQAVVVFSIIGWLSGGLHREKGNDGRRQIHSGMSGFRDHGN
jgi:threonine/homoserine/homoserine lactone efflux protein